MRTHVRAHVRRNSDWRNDLILAHNEGQTRQRIANQETDYKSELRGAITDAKTEQKIPTKDGWVKIDYKKYAGESSYGWTRATKQGAGEYYTFPAKGYGTNANVTTFKTINGAKRNLIKTLGLEK